MATLYEYYNTGDNDYWGFKLDEWVAQTFTPSIAHKITSVKLLLYKSGSPGTITVGIRATDVSGHPTGDDLCLGTTDGNTLTEDEAGEWRQITLGDGYDLAADTQYAIVVRIAVGGPENELDWRLLNLNPTYAGGCLEYSENSGSTWESSTDYDFMFEDWGEPLAKPMSRGYIIG